MAEIIQFKKRKPSDISKYIDFDKGWKFTEDDKDFLVSYYEETIKALTEECGGDFVDDYQKILDSIIKNGVDASKDLIQVDAKILSEAVADDIYNYYKNCHDTLKLIENSILDVQW